MGDELLVFALVDLQRAKTTDYIILKTDVLTQLSVFGFELAQLDGQGLNVGIDDAERPSNRRQRWG